MKHLTSYIFLSLFLFIAVKNSFAQNSQSVFGVVKDVKTGELLWGANVSIKGSSLGATTDRDGKFLISNVPSGKIRLVCSYVGYQSDTAKITLTGKNTEVNFQLSFGGVSLNAVIITAQAEGQLAAINQQLNSNTIVNIVSKEKLQELPDANAAESIGRLPGASIVRDGGEGTKVVIRGLEPKMNAVTVNGVRVPSNEANDRSVDLSMFSPDILDGIELTKALTPDKDADAIGGSIDLKLKRAPTDSHQSLLVQQGYNRHGKDFIPMKINASYSSRFFNNDLGVLVQGVYDKADRGSDIFSAGYSILREKKASEIYAPTILSSLNLSDDRQTRTKFGGSLLLDYTIPNGNIQLNTTYNRLNLQQVTRKQTFTPGSNDMYYYITDLKNYTDLLITSFSGDYSFFNAIFTDWNLAYTGTTNKTPDSYNTTFYESSAYKSTPVVNQGPLVLPGFAKNDSSGYLQYIGRSSNLTKGKDVNFSFNTRIPFVFSLSIPYVFDNDISSYVKFGARYKGKWLDYSNRMNMSPMYYSTTALTHLKALYPGLIGIGGTQGVSMVNFLESGYSTSSEFLNGQYSIPYFANPVFMNTIINQLTPYLVKRRDYEANNYSDREDITGVYGMVNFNIGTKLTILAGVRYEYLAARYTSYYNNIQVATDGTEMGEISPLKGSNRNKYWFPQFHVRYKVTDWFDIRLARTRSLSRPDFLALNPYLQINETSQTINRGNPILKSLTAENYDASVSIFDSQLGLFSVSGFYKELHNVFYKYSRVVLTPSDYNLDARFKGWALTDYINSPNTAYVRGIEFDLQTHFSGVVININYSKIASATMYPFSIVRVQYVPTFKKTVIDTARAGRLIYQPNDVVNVSVGYDYKDFSGRFSVLFQGNTLSGVGNRIETDGTTADLLRWDLSLKQKIIDNVKIFFNINNIFNRPDRSYNPITNFDTSLKYYGLTSDFGVQYQL